MTYEQMVANLVKPGKDILHDMREEDAHLLHMAVGISGEAGEILDCIKKAAIYCKDIDMDNLIEELGDMEFYLEGLRAAFGISRDECLYKNMKKLRKRYKAGTYSNQQAQERRDKK